MTLHPATVKDEIWRTGRMNIKEFSHLTAKKQVKKIGESSDQHVADDNATKIITIYQIHQVIAHRDFVGVRRV